MGYDKNNIFAKIIRGEIPCNKVYEDTHVVAFNDLHPKAPVHILIMPKGEYINIIDFTQKASPEEVDALFKAAGEIAKQQGLEESGFRVITNCGANGGQEIPHLHLHLLGGKKLGGLVG